MRYFLLSLLLLKPLAALAEPLPPFTRLSSLVGEWEAKSQKGNSIRVRYRLVSAGSVLVQEFMPGTAHETLTVFHADGPRVLATHYCAQGNQPRLQSAASMKGERLTFAFVDGTNLKPEVARLVTLELRLDGPLRYTEVETYEQAGKLDITTLQFQRVH